MNLITRSHLASLAGVSRSAITKACKTTLARACVGDRLDLDHSDAQKYLSSRNPAPSKPTLRLTPKDLDAVVDAVFERVLARLRRQLRPETPGSAP